MCLNMQTHALKVELDVKVIFDLMSNAGSLNATNSSIVADCVQSTNIPNSSS